MRAVAESERERSAGDETRVIVHVQPACCVASDVPKLTSASSM